MKGAGLSQVAQLEIADGFMDGFTVDFPHEFADIFELSASGAVGPGLTGQIDGTPQHIRHIDGAKLIR